MNTKRLKRRLIKAIYKMNPRDEIIRARSEDIRITAMEKIGKKIFMRYYTTSWPPYLHSSNSIELNILSLLELVYIYESLKKHDTEFRIFRP